MPNDGSAAAIAVGDQVAWVDAADAERVRAHTWGPKRDERCTYAVATIDGKRVGLHQFILGEDVSAIDHKDCDGLNNRRANLRPATHAENTRNRRVPEMDKSSRFKGVSRKSSIAPWKATICYNRQRIVLGEFRSEEDAARAYDAAAKRYFGEFAKTNADMGIYDKPASLRIGGRYLGSAIVPVVSAA